MTKHACLAALLAAISIYGISTGMAQPAAEPATNLSQAASDAASLLGPPKEGGPVVVRASFEFHDIDEISEENEAFEFTGVLTLTWQDKRQAFNPATAGVSEKVYQGDYQFNELAPSWYPQAVLVNSSDSFEEQGVVLRAQPDGTQILKTKLLAVAKTEFDLRRYPFDKQRLEAVFEVLGFDHNEVVLKVDPRAPVSAGKLWVPQWIIAGVSMSVRSHAASHAGGRDIESALVASVDVERQPFYVSRLVILPLIVIVLLSFSVFWMDRASLGDRISVSFIGILTAVAYQVVMNDILPRIAYPTWINAFLNVSFLLMVGTVIINLVVGRLDAHGKHDVSHRVDLLCRWSFPLSYFGLIVILFGVAFLLY